MSDSRAVSSDRRGGFLWTPPFRRSREPNVTQQRQQVATCVELDCQTTVLELLGHARLA